MTDRERSEAEARIAALEEALQRERSAAFVMRRWLEVKEQEIVEIHRSRAWGTIAFLRTFKHRRIDPLLGFFGLSWPRRRCAPDSDVLPFAVPFDHFAATPRRVNGRPTIGYYGAIADWFDTDLVTELARRRPDWDFVLIGSTYGAAVGALARLPNLSLPGEEPYESLPEWLGRFDVAIIPRIASAPGFRPRRSSDLPGE